MRRWVAPVPEGQLRRLPAGLQDAHRRWADSAQGAPAGRVRVRGRLMALDLLAAGADPGRVEGHLLGSGLHPAVAHKCSAWARARHLAVLQATGPTPGPATPGPSQSVAAWPYEERNSRRVRTPKPVPPLVR